MRYRSEARRYEPEDFERHLRRANPRPVMSMPLHVSVGSVADRARRYVARIPGAVSGQHGHDLAFHVACLLVLGFGLSVDRAYPILAGWNRTCRPPWSDGELLHKPKSAEARDDVRGYMLADNRRKHKGWTNGR